MSASGVTLSLKVQGQGRLWVKVRVVGLGFNLTGVQPVGFDGKQRHKVLPRQPVFVAVTFEHELPKVGARDKYRLDGANKYVIDRVFHAVPTPALITEEHRLLYSSCEEQDGNSEYYGPANEDRDNK